MEFFIALLPLLAFLGAVAGLAWLAFDSPPYLWSTYHLVVLETLWICQLVTDNVTDDVFHFLFVASVYCGLGIIICWRRLLRYLQAPAP